MAARGKQRIARAAVEQILQDVEAVAAEIQAVTVILEEQQIDEIEAMNYPMVIEAVDRMRRFVHSCEKGIGEIVKQRRKPDTATRIKASNSSERTQPGQRKGAK